MCLQIPLEPTNFTENFVGSWNVVNGGKKKNLLIQFLQTNFGWYSDSVYICGGFTVNNIYYSLGNPD